MNKDRISAVVLAAGYSSRMGCFKPLLPLGGTTVLERVIALFREVCISDIRVVVGYRADELLPLLSRAQVPCIRNERFGDGMFSSVLEGFASLRQSPVDLFFLLPVDIPLVRPSTLRQLLRAFSPGGAAKVLYPAFLGKRGHPPLIAMEVADQIARMEGAGCLKGALQRFERQALQVEVPDENILSDMDTPADCRKIQMRWEDYDTPSVAECESIMTRVFPVPEGVGRHSRQVAQLAARMGIELNRAGCRLNLGLITAGALLHDIAKGQPRHDLTSAGILRGMGFSQTADIVASHLDIDLSDREAVDEAQVVYLADKMTRRETYLVDFTESFQDKLKQFADIPSVQQRIRQRLEHALAIRARIEELMSQSLDSLVQTLAPAKSDRLRGNEV
jgi:CTP:molybdopterin cytidylyltransferase MocA/5'-deoxynucleotidase YfbR-like HD superfamily hydrolase